MLAALLGFLSPAQKRLIFIGLPVFGALGYAGVTVYEQTNYGPLYTNLAPQDGAAVVKELEADKIPYALTNGGTVIEVPRGVLYQTRLKLAGKGVPAGSGVGFEIFEKNQFGASEFTQQVNYLRAQQGELTRTINAIAAVQSSRVHLAIPSRTNFLGPEEKPSASVVIDLRPGFRLSPDQVQGIVNLVAGSVPKLSADKVTVIDGSGRPLKEITVAAATTEAEKANALKLKHEAELQRRVETMLDPVLGAGKVIVRTNVQINLQETLMTKEEFDPDNKVVRSQRQANDDSGTIAKGAPGVQANLPGGDGAAKTTEAASKRSSEMVTYEVGRTTSRTMEPRGQIQKLSVAVMVDGKYENEKYLPRSAEEMETIKGIVKRAVGFDSERGDEIEIANVAFTIPAPAVSAPAGPQGVKEFVQTPMGMGVAGGALLVVGVVAFLLMRRKKPVAVAEPVAEHAMVPAEAAPAVDEVQEEVVAAAKKIVVSNDPRKEQLAQIAHDYHDASVRIIRAWLQEDAAKARAAANIGASNGN